MAISFKKEVIAEAIKEVLAESQQVYLITNDPKSKDDAIKAAQKAGAKDPQFYKQIKDMKPGDTITAEDHHEDPNDESDMAKVQLANVIHYAQELLTMIKDGQQLDAWVQSKLTIAFDYIDSVKHYLEGEDYLAATEAPAEEEPIAEEEDYDMELDNLKGPSKKDLEGEKVKSVASDKAEAFNRALAFIKKHKDKPEVVKAMLQKAKDVYKLPKPLLKNLASAALDEVLAEGATCCGRCGRVHESSQECKKPYISKDSPKHCKNKK